MHKDMETRKLFLQHKPKHWKELNKQNNWLRKPAHFDACKLGQTLLRVEVNYHILWISSDPGPPAGLPHLRPAKVIQKSIGVGSRPPLWIFCNTILIAFGVSYLLFGQFSCGISIIILEVGPVIALGWLEWGDLLQEIRWRLGKQRESILHKGFVYFSQVAEGIIETIGFCLLIFIHRLVTILQGYFHHV